MPSIPQGSGIPQLPEPAFPNNRAAHRSLERIPSDHYRKGFRPASLARSTSSSVEWAFLFDAVQMLRLVVELFAVGPQCSESEHASDRRHSATWTHRPSCNRLVENARKVGSVVHAVRCPKFDDDVVSTSQSKIEHVRHPDSTRGRTTSAAA
jgi:hypothetical protein